MKIHFYNSKAAIGRKIKIKVLGVLTRDDIKTISSNFNKCFKNGTYVSHCKMGGKKDWLLDRAYGYPTEPTKNAPMPEFGDLVIFPVPTGGRNDLVLICKGVLK